MSATEVNADRPANPAGLYIHKESGNTLEATTSIQGDAFVRLGFVLATDEDVAEPAEKPLNKQTKSELLATAEAEGVEVSEDLTVKEIREAIEAQRGE